MSKTYKNTKRVQLLKCLFYFSSKKLIIYAVFKSLVPLNKQEMSTKVVVLTLSQSCSLRQSISYCYILSEEKMHLFICETVC